MKTRPLRLLTNALANYAGQLTAVVAGVLLTPILVDHLGSSMYGVLTLVMAMQGLGGLFNLGLTTGITKYVAGHYAHHELDEINHLVSTAFFLHVCVGIMVFILAVMGALFGLPLLRLAPDQLEVARAALVVAGASLLLALPLGVWGSLLLGLRHYEWSNAITIVQTLAAVGATVLVLHLRGGPAAIIAVNGLSLALACIVKMVLAFRLLPGLRLSIRLATRRTVRRLGTYSLWLFVLDLAEQIFSNADPIMIAAFLPIGQVATYNVGFKPASALLYLSGPFVSVFLPEASELRARGEIARLQRLLMANTRLVLAVTLPAAVWLAVFGRQVLTVWVGPQHQDALPVLCVFVAIFVASAAQQPAGVILQGMGLVRALALCVATEYIVNIALSLILIPRLGVLGAAVGTLAPILCIDLVVIPWLICRALKVDYVPFMVKTVARPLVAAVPTLALLWPISRWLAAPSLGSVAAAAVLTGLFFGLFYVLLAVSGDERAALGQKVQALLGRPLAAGETIGS